MNTLATQPDSVLVSAETVHDFQLQPGDLLRLRLQRADSNRSVTVPFQYAGVAKEFPTAPTDSFLVANAYYVAQQTGSDSVGTFLIQTDGSDPATVAANVRAAVGPTAKVTDIVNQRKVVGSNLTAVELSGLTNVELSFAVVLAIVASGLNLALSFHERRRTFAIAAAIGARTRQLGGFVWGEAAFVAGFGIALGAAIAGTITVILIKVLTGVFDPPPDSLAVPAGYLMVMLAVVAAAIATAGVATLRALRLPAIEELRDL
jgi:putative ABC transport system permease protein